jgi:hypothetical protein
MMRMMIMIMTMMMMMFTVTSTYIRDLTSQSLIPLVYTTESLGT